MATKKRTSTEKGLKSDVKEQRARAEKAEARADRWKAKADRYQRDAAELRAELKKVAKRLRKSERSQPAPATAAPAADRPDASWTVARLRAEGRSRGLSGVTTKTKAQLLDLLST